MLARSLWFCLSYTIASHPHHSLRSLHKAPTDPSLRERHAAWLAVCCLGSVSSILQNENVLILLPVSAIARHAFPTQLLCATDNKAAIDGNGRSESEECVGEVERRESRLWMEQSAQANQHPRQTRTCSL